MATEKTRDEPNPTHTPIRRFRAPGLLWEAYESVCARVFSRERSEDLVHHIRSVIREHGNAAEVAALEKAEQELAERRARKGGRPRKQPDAGE